MTVATALWALCALLVLVALWMLLSYFGVLSTPPVRLIVGAMFAIVAVAIVLDAFGVVSTGVIRR